MAVPCLTWESESPAGRPVHVARHALPRPGGIAPHRHSFGEVFWCESGSGVHRVGGAEQRIAPGDLVCLRPDDVHGLDAIGNDFTFLNVSFPWPAAQALAAHAGETWPWNRPPQAHRLAAPVLLRLAAWADDLAGPGCDALARDAFLLDLARLLRGAGIPADAGQPAWLREGLDWLRAGRLAGGVPALAGHCDRSIAHLNRTVRRHHGCTATDLVNRLRLDEAARALRLGEATVAEVAANVGLPHLGHFYGLFHARFGVTPRHYRRDGWRLAGR